MAQQRIPGLVPTGQTNFPLQRVASRGQAPDPEELAPRPLQPTVSPVDTYVRPQEAQTDVNTRALAESLAVLNPELQKFFAIKRQGHGEAALELIQRTDPAELDARIRSGDVPPELQNYEGTRIFAQDRARRDARVLIERYNTDFARGEGDLTALFNEVTGATFEEFGDDPLFRRVYSDTIESTRQQLQDQHSADQTDRVMTERRDSVFSNWTSLIDTRMREGVEPLLIVQEIFDDVPGNRDFLRLQPKEQMGMMVNLADDLVRRGDPQSLALARALLTTQRTEGPYRGTILQDSDLSPQASAIMGRIVDAEARLSLKTAHENSYAAYNAGVDEMVRNGTIGSLQDGQIMGPNGQMMDIPRERGLKEAAQRAQASIEQTRGYDEMTPEQQFALEESVFLNSPMENPKWFDTMESGFLQLNSSTVTGEDLPPNTTHGFYIWRELRADGNNYLVKHIDPDTHDYYRTAQVLLDYGLAGDPEEALRAAYVNTANWDPSSATAAQQATEIDKLVGTAIEESWGYFGGPVAASNEVYVRDELNELAGMFARNGLSATLARDEALKEFLEDHMNVRGTYIRKSVHLPDDFPDIVERYLVDFAERHAEDEGYELDDLTIAPLNDATGGWRIVLRSTGMPADTDDRDYFFNLRQLEELRGKESEEAAEAAAADVNARIDQREAVEDDYRRVGIDPNGLPEPVGTDPRTGQPRTDLRPREPRLNDTLAPDTAIRPEVAPPRAPEGPLDDYRAVGIDPITGQPIDTLSPPPLPILPSR